MLSTPTCHIEKLKKKLSEGINSKAFGFFFQIIMAYPYEYLAEVFVIYETSFYCFFPSSQNLSFHLNLKWTGIHSSFSTSVNCVYRLTRACEIYKR